MDEKFTTINLSRKYSYFPECEVFRNRQGVLLAYLYFTTIVSTFHANVIQSMDFLKYV